MRSRVRGRLVDEVEVGDRRRTLSWRVGAILFWLLVLRDVGSGMARSWVSSLFSVESEHGSHVGQDEMYSPLIFSPSFEISRGKTDAKDARLLRLVQNMAGCCCVYVPVVGFDAQIVSTRGEVEIKSPSRLPGLNVTTVVYSILLQKGGISCLYIHAP